MKEIWKDIAGYEGLYQVSNYGIVMSLPREWICGANKMVQSHNGKILKPQLDGGNYQFVTLTKNGKSRIKKIHRLVAEAFISNPENKPEVNHKKGIKSNNRVENLEWATSKENVVHAVKNGLRKGPCGISNVNSKFTEKQIIELRLKYSENKESYRKIARENGVSEKTIRYILQRKTWTHI